MDEQQSSSSLFPSTWGKGGGTEWVSITSATERVSSNPPSPSMDGHCLAQRKSAQWQSRGLELDRRRNESWSCAGSFPPKLLVAGGRRHKPPQAVGFRVARGWTRGAGACTTHTNIALMMLGFPSAHHGLKQPRVRMIRWV